MYVIAAKLTLYCFKGTRDLELLYKMSDDNSLIDFLDVNQADDNLHSTIGNLFVMSGGTISCRKRPVVALSTTEAEYVVMTLSIE